MEEYVNGEDNVPVCIWSMTMSWKIKFFADLNAADSLAPAEDANEEEKEFDLEPCL